MDKLPGKIESYYFNYAKSNSIESFRLKHELAPTKNLLIVIMYNKDDKQILRDRWLLKDGNWVKL